MPFITEEIWSKINPSGGRIIVSKWPEAEKKFNFPDEAEDADIFKEIVYRIRNIRAEMNIAPAKNANVVFKTSDKKVISLIDRELINIKSLAKLDEVKIDANYKPENTDASAIMKDVEIYCADERAYRY